MPHVVIKCFKQDIGAAQLAKLREGVTTLLTQTIGCNLDAVSIDLQQVEPERWREQVFDPEIAPRLATLLRQPGYR